MSGAAYINLNQPEVWAEPTVTLRGVRRTPIVVVGLGDAVTMHVLTAVQARALANAFTKAAELLEATP